MSTPSGGDAYLGYGKDGEHWERDLEARYVVQNGDAKGTAISLRYNVHRSNTPQAEVDANQIRLAIEHPMNGGFWEANCLPDVLHTQGPGIHIRGACLFRHGVGIGDESTKLR